MIGAAMLACRVRRRFLDRLGATQPVTNLSCATASIWGPERLQERNVDRSRLARRKPPRLSRARPKTAPLSSRRASSVKPARLSPGTEGAFPRSSLQTASDRLLRQFSTKEIVRSKAALLRLYVTHRRALTETWGADGNIIAALNVGGGLTRIPVDGGKLQVSLELKIAISHTVAAGATGQ